MASPADASLALPPAALAARPARPRVRTSRRAALGWYVLLAAVLLVQFAAYHATAARDIAPFVPRFDQTAYLSQTYDIYEDLRARGPVPGLLEALDARRAQGWLLQPEAAALMLLLGPGRLAALDLNILYWLACLAVTATVVRHALGVPAALLALGLLTVAGTTTFYLGGIFDFRLDFAALCLWGMLIGLTAFAYPSSSAARLGVVALGLLLVGTRLIAAAYLLPLFALLGLATWWPPAAERLGASAAMRAWLGATLLVWLAALGLIVVRNHEAIAAYYVVGHITGDEPAVRALETGVGNLLAGAVYYPRLLLTQHAGPAFWLLAALALGAAALVRRRPRVGGAPLAPLGALPPAWAAGVLLLGLAVPAVVLVLNKQKSPVAGNVLVVPVALLIVLAFAWLGGRAGAAGGAARGRWPLAVGALVLAIGLLVRGYTLSQPRHPAASAEDMQRATAFVDDLAAHLQASGLTSGVWSTDQHFDWLATGALNVVNYERRGQRLFLRPGLGQGTIVDQLTPAEILALASTSDALVLTTATTDPRPLIYPADQDLATQRPALLALAEREMERYREVTAFQHTLVAYVRPAALIEGLSGGWITSAGIALTLPPHLAGRASRVVLAGASELHLLPAMPAVTATLRGAGGDLPLPARLVAQGNEYTLTVELDDAARERAAGARIELAFSTHFVPHALGDSGDTRELVLRAPTRRHVELTTD